MRFLNDSKDSKLTCVFWMIQRFKDSKPRDGFWMIQSLWMDIQRIWVFKAIKDSKIKIVFWIIQRFKNQGCPVSCRVVSCGVRVIWSSCRVVSCSCLIKSRRVVSCQFQSIVKLQGKQADANCSKNQDFGLHAKSCRIVSCNLAFVSCRVVSLGCVANSCSVVSLVNRVV